MSTCQQRLFFYLLTESIRYSISADARFSWQLEGLRTPANSSAHLRALNNSSLRVPRSPARDDNTGILASAGVVNFSYTINNICRLWPCDASSTERAINLLVL